MASSRNSRSPDPVLAALRAASVRHGLAGGRITVGLSGGRDSVALLHGLSQLRGEFRIALGAHHVHHGLSPNADRWAQFCSAFCEELEVPFESTCVSVDRAGGEGVEAAARAARYAALATLDTDWIALAHHRGDQAETLLHNLLRGSGLRGLSGMPAERPLGPAGAPRIVRPLLDVPRSAIDDYLAHHALAWVEDESNTDTGYTRNWLRGEVMPLLARPFPALEATLARTAAQAAEAEALLDALAAHDMTVVAPAGHVRLDALRHLDAPRGRNLLRRLLRDAGERMPDAVRLAELQRQLAAIGHDTAFVFDFEHVELRCFAGVLHLLKKPAGPQASSIGLLRVPWAGEPHLDWPGGSVVFESAIGRGLAADRVSGARCHLATRQGGESIRPDARRPRRTLKHWYQELCVPPWERDARPVLWCGDAVAWVPGIGVDVDFACAAGQAGWMAKWVRHA